MALARAARPLSRMIECGVAVSLGLTGASSTGERFLACGALTSWAWTTGLVCGAAVCVGTRLKSWAKRDSVETGTRGASSPETERTAARCCRALPSVVRSSINSTVAPRRTETSCFCTTRSRAARSRAGLILGLDLSCCFAPPDSAIPSYPTGTEPVTFL
jgi:hypothetical protein